MARKKKKKAVTMDAKNLRNIAMFKKWVQGIPMEKIAEEFGMSVQMIRHISSQSQWAKARKALYAKQYSSAIDTLQPIVSDLIGALSDDFKRLNKKRTEKPDTLLDKDERKHIMEMTQQFIKEIRLEAGKPTDINTGVRQIRYILPEGVKRFGVTHASGNISYTNAKKDDPTKQLEDIDITELNDPKEDK